MAKKFLYAALAGVSLLFAGCSEDLVGDYVQPTEKHFGEEIMFGGSASYDVNGNGGTRTIYGGYENITDGAEPVYWVSTDEVRLYCPEAAVKTADYKVSDIDDTKTQTGLSKIGDAGLQWGVPTASHTFYGVYPIPADNSLKEGTTLTGTIPDVQEYKDYTVENDNVVYNPNMQYAYMVAKTVVNKPNEMPASVYMKFTPIATAVEIELQNDANEKAYDFREVHLSSTNHYLSGTFTADLVNMGLGGNSNDNVRYGTGCPTGITYGADAEKQVAVHLYTEEGAAMTLPAKKTLTFTIFMMPSNQAASDTDVIDDLKITLITSDGNKTGTLQNISIKKSKKNYMHMMPIGGDMTYNQSEWLKYVDDEKKLNALSIPGAGGAASGKEGYGEAAWNTDQDYLEQELSISELWNVGIRCFEFTVDKNETAGGDISDNIVYCNGKACGTTTLGQAVGGVKSLLMQHPEEFAMVILTYQDNDGWDIDARDPHEWQSQINAFWKKVAEGKNDDTDVNDTYDDAWTTGTSTGLYDASATLGTSRGKLFCIARPTSLGEDNGIKISSTESEYGFKTHYRVNGISQKDTPLTVSELHEDILVINGWGSLKDKWVARGYSPCVFHRGTGNDELTELIEEGFGAMMGYDDSYIGRPVDIQTTSITDGSSLSTLGANYVTNLIDGNKDNKELVPDFSYDCQKMKDGSLTTTTDGVWAQEWARVSDTDGTFMLKATGKSYWSDNISTTTCYMQWSETYSEKIKRIQECLDMSIANTTDKIYINSLCGYFIDRSSEGSSSAYFNGITDYNAYYEVCYSEYVVIPRSDFCVTYLTGQDVKGGMSGNIASFATKVNADFLTYLQSKLNSMNRLGGSTGIVLMDRVSNKDDGAAIPSIIIANNFSSDYEATDPTAPTSVVADGDTPLSREGVNIVWGEWE